MGKLCIRSNRMLGMDEETFMLKWKSFSENASYTLEEETKRNNFSDVTLVSNDLKPFKVHKFVLSACSPVLKDILLNNQHSHPTIYLNGIQSEDLKAILQLIYCGEANVCMKRLKNLFQVVKEFQLTGFDLPNLEKEFFRTERKSKMLGKQRKMGPKYTDFTYEEIEEDRRYDCGQCDYKATHIGNLKRHVQGIHEGIRYECNECEYR